MNEKVSKTRLTKRSKSVDSEKKATEKYRSRRVATEIIESIGVILNGGYSRAELKPGTRLDYGGKLSKK